MATSFDFYSWNGSAGCTDTTFLILGPDMAYDRIVTSITNINLYIVQKYFTNSFIVHLGFSQQPVDPHNPRSNQIFKFNTENYSLTKKNCEILDFSVDIRRLTLANFSISQVNQI